MGDSQGGESEFSPLSRRARIYEPMAIKARNEFRNRETRVKLIRKLAIGQIITRKNLQIIYNVHVYLDLFPWRYNMPSFDVVSKVDLVELGNAIDQANREVSTRFDFKDTGAKFDFSQDKITLTAPSDFQLQQMRDILQNKVAKRGVDIRTLDYQEPEISLHEARITANVKQGVSQEDAKKIVKLIKDTKLKVQASIQGDQVRVNGKKRDDLQAVIAMLKESSLYLPLQFENFRD
jgi:uncharacterized protein YajQ (UPF0234 family)